MNRLGVFRCLLAAVLFGVAAPAASELAGSVPAFTLAGLLYLGAAIAVLPTVIRRPPSPDALVSEWKPAMVAVVAGGAFGPLLLVGGLARTDAASASILLNTELPATVILAAVVFREHLGRRLLWSAGLITLAGALLTWEPGAVVDVGAVLIIAACVLWGLDNGTRRRPGSSDLCHRTVHRGSDRVDGARRRDFHAPDRRRGACRGRRDGVARVRPRARPRSRAPGARP